MVGFTEIRSVANDADQAESYFTQELGFSREHDGIVALEVANMPSSLPVSEPMFADEDIIIACGGELKTFHDVDLKLFLDQSILESLGAETRVVKLGDVIYVEGNVLRASLEYLKSR